MKTNELINLYAIDTNLKTYHYKVLLILTISERCQSELCALLGVSKQNINKICKDLLSIDYISYGKIIGRNKYLKINLKPNIQIKGQVDINHMLCQKEKI